ncbi:MAG: hypothetical protein ACFE95_14885 [Candidatus Hodarchaeota archaeon]
MSLLIQGLVVYARDPIMDLEYVINETNIVFVATFNKKGYILKIETF